MDPQGLSGSSEHALCVFSVYLADMYNATFKTARSKKNYFVYPTHTVTLDIDSENEELRLRLENVRQPTLASGRSGKHR